MPITTHEDVKNLIATHASLHPVKKKIQAMLRMKSIDYVFDPTDTSLTAQQKKKAKEDFETLMRECELVRSFLNREIDAISECLAYQDTEEGVLEEKDYNRLEELYTVLENDVKMYGKAIEKLEPIRDRIDQMETVVYTMNLHKAPTAEAVEVKTKYSLVKKVPNKIVEYKYQDPGVAELKGTSTLRVVDYQAIRTSSGLSGLLGKSQYVKSQMIEAKVKEFPKKAGPEDEALKQARVMYALTFAENFLLNMNAAPTQSLPIKISGKDPVKLAYIKAAFIHLGANNPHLKFDTKCIEVMGPDTIEDYKSRFHANPVVEANLKTYVGLSLKKHGTKSDQESVKDIAVQIDGLFKGKLKSFKEEAEAREEEEDGLGL